MSEHFFPDKNESEQNRTFQDKHETENRQSRPRKPGAALPVSSVGCLLQNVSAIYSGVCGLFRGYSVRAVGTMAFADAIYCLKSVFVKIQIDVQRRFRFVAEGDHLVGGSQRGVYAAHGQFGNNAQ